MASQLPKVLKQGTLFSFFKKPAAAAAVSSSSAAVHSNNKKNEPKLLPSLPPPKEPLLLQVKIGDRIEVYWTDDDEYYAATVTQQRHDSTPFYFLEYDDGQTEWLDLAQETFRRINQRNSPKRRHIRDDDDEVEFDATLESVVQDDDGSVFEPKKNLHKNDDQDNWLVSDEEEEEDIRPQKKKLKVTKYTTDAIQKTPSARKNMTLSQFGHTPKSVTPLSASTFSPLAAAPSSYYSTPPTSTTPRNNNKVTPFVKDAVNPVGSHVHNHLPFLQHPVDMQRRSQADPEYDPRTLLVLQQEWVAVTGKDMTDAVQQWWDLKSQYFDTVLLFKTGKFYEMFHMDADVGVQVLGLLYMKGAVAHAGFPEISYGSMADKLVRAGYKVARVEQTETPDQLKIRKSKHHKSKGPSPKVVNREVCSVMTLGTRTFCYLDEGKDVLEEGGGAVGPLLAIREILMENDDCDETDGDHVQPVCEYGITAIDAVRGIVTIGQFADDVLRSRMNTLLATFAPSEVLLEAGVNGASPVLESLIKSHQSMSPHPFRVEKIKADENFPKSTALSQEVRQALERGKGRLVGVIHPWDVEETVQELHRRRYFPRASKVSSDQCAVSRWPHVLRAAVEGEADLAMSSFGAALFYLQRSLIDSEILTMGVVKAYVPPSSTNNTEAESSGTIQELASQQSRMQVEDAIQHNADLVSPPRVERRNEEADSHSVETQVDHMQLDGTTLHNLEILTNSVDYKVAGSVWSKINHTKTPHGARLLRAWLLRPLFRKADIDRRADAVQELVSGAPAVALTEASRVLSKCGDIERLLSRIHSMSGAVSLEDTDENEGIHPSNRAVLYEMGTYTKRKVGDFSKILNGLQHAAQIPEIFQGIELESGLLLKIVRPVDQGGCFPDMCEQLDWFVSNFDCDQAAQGLFEPKRGIDEAYDEACETIDHIQADLIDYKKEMCDTVLKPRPLAISSWKYVNVNPESKDKYLIELPASVAVPDDFIMKGKRGNGHKQVNKYCTATIQQLVDELEIAYEIQKERKSKGLQLIFAKFDASRNIWAAAAQATALLDAIGSLARVALKAGYIRPTILDCLPNESPKLNIIQGRHPCVENNFGSTGFIPNDLSLGHETEGASNPRVLLLSGPNMGGKSTLLRQTCLITILSQIGSFVPAEKCEITPVDRIYTRLGASDRLLLGQSTFFVELAETAAALRGATRRSLVIMDELGRGTSTFDGTAIASSTIKHFVERSKCLVLFATHYHSLLEEWKSKPSVMLGHMECMVGNGSIETDSGGIDNSVTFLYTLGSGVCPKSFGINVAQLAGLPHDVLQNAKRISLDFERELQGNNNHITARNAPDLHAQVKDTIERKDWEALFTIWKQLQHET